MVALLNFYTYYLSISCIEFTNAGTCGIVILYLVGSIKT